MMEDRASAGVMLECGYTVLKLWYLIQPRAAMADTRWMEDSMTSTSLLIQILT